MAVVFTPDGGSELVIGGQSTGNGLIGPFPKYSISRENVYSSDGNYLNTKFTINVNGTAVIRSDDSQDITEKGRRQSRIQGEASNILKLARGSPRGVLEISPYGGLANTIRFEATKLLSAEVTEQSDESAGIQNLPYTFVFESYLDASTNENSGNIDEFLPVSYWVTDTKESWEFQINNDVVSYQDNNPTGNINKSYTITRSLSATGIYNPIDDETPILQAKKWVESKLTSTLPVNINPDSLNLSHLGLNTYDISTEDNWVDVSAHTNINHVRSVSSDIIGGSYSTTDTWTLHKGANATHDISVQLDNAVESPAATVSVTMNIQGIDTNTYDNITSNKYDNALVSFNVLKTQAYAIANAMYTDAAIGGTLKTTKISEGITTNKNTGQINYNCSFNDVVTLVEGAISESIQITDDNEDGLNQIIAKIDIIGKADGPVIQDMQTTTIKNRAVTIDLVMDKQHRTSKPSTAAMSIANSYKPPGDAFRQAKNESWNPKTGSYNLSVNWDYAALNSSSPPTNPPILF